MAGNFTRLDYDRDAYNDKIVRTTGPSNYRLDPNYAINCNRCFSPYGARNGHENAVAVGDKIDVDSILRGVNNINTKSNTQQAPKPLTQYQTYIPKDCSNILETEYSRFTNPSFDIKGLNVPDMRFGYPLHDPQCQIFENFEVNTRLQSKDNHCSIWQVPLDQRSSLPSERVGNIKKSSPSPSCAYLPYASLL